MPDIKSVYQKDFSKNIDEFKNDIRKIDSKTDYLSVFLNDLNEKIDNIYKKNDDIIESIFGLNQESINLNSKFECLNIEVKTSTKKMSKLQKLNSKLRFTNSIIKKYAMVRKKKASTEKVLPFYDIENSPVKINTSLNKLNVSYSEKPQIFYYNTRSKVNANKTSLNDQTIRNVKPILKNDNKVKFSIGSLADSNESSSSDDYSSGDEYNLGFMDELGL